MCSIEEGSAEAVQSTTDPPLVPVQDTSTLDKSTTNISSTVSSSSRKQRQVCKYIVSKKRCPYGDRCRFRHPQPISQQPVCRHYLGGSCRHGDKCRYRHPVANTTNTGSSGEEPDNEPSLLNVSSFPSLSTEVVPKPYKEDRHAPPPSVKDPDESTGRGRGSHDRGKGHSQQGGPPALQLEAFFKRSMDITPRPPVSRPNKKGNNSSILRNTEINQLELRYPSHSVREKTMEHTIYNIQFYPSDPDWKHSSHSLDIDVKFPSSYPEQKCEVQVKPDGVFTTSFIAAVNSELMAQTNVLHHKNVSSGQFSLMFRPLMQWLDSHIVQIANGCHNEVLNFSEEQSDNSDSYIDSDGDSDRDDDDGDEDDEGGDDSEGDSGEDGDGSKYIRPSKKGTEIRLMELQMSEGVATLKTNTLKLTLQCTRCKNNQDITTKADTCVSEACSKCHSCLSVVLHPDVVHAANTTLAFMDLKGCKPLDVVLSVCDCTIGCMECGRECQVKSLSYGQPMKTWCRSCHTLLSISIQQCKFFVHQSVEGVSIDQTGSTVIKTKKVREERLQEGKPLPELGTCVHYKKSHRWLRFPCCGKAYPCDVCHDLMEDHPMERANRMICGYCSKEQTYTTVKPCVLCGSDMAFANSSAYWEGGKGCRNKKKMSRNDVKKYSSLSKTTSKKEERVGAKGKANRAK